MGVRGLETYLEKYNSDACYKIRIKDALNNYRQEYKRTPVVVVDGMSIMRYVYNIRHLPWVPGGQLKEYEDVMKNFIGAFHREGAKLVFFFDGPLVKSKKETWVKRRIETLGKVYRLFDDLKHGTKLQTIESGRFSLLPPNLNFVTRQIAKNTGCEVITSVRECDLEIAEYVAVHECMAVLAQDSDFVIFSGPLYYWSMKNFNLDDMTTLNYDRLRLARSLHLSVDRLPLLATLLGNDILSYEDLSNYHRSILNRCSNGYNYSKKWIDFPTLIREVAAYVGKLPVGPYLDNELTNVSRRVFGDETKVDILRESILSYDLKAPINKKPDRPSSEDENWDQILKLLHEPEYFNNAFATIYGIVAQQSYQCSTALEDFRLSDLPPSQTILKPIRERLYGVLLHEKPGDIAVEEWVMCGPRSLDDAVWITPIPPSVEHPGLITLWTTETDAKWILLSDVLGIDTSKLRETVPLHLTVPVLTLKYLSTRLVLEHWEMQALVSSAILVIEYSPAVLSQLSIPNTYINTRSFRLYSLVCRAYSTVMFTINGLGDPVNKDMISPTKYQDGKLYQLKYKQASDHATVAVLCDYKVHVIETFNILMDFITGNVATT